MLIVLAVMGLLATIAIPAFQNYMRRAYFTDVVKATAVYQSAVTHCYLSQRKLTNCNAGSHDIPQAMTSTEGPVASIDVSEGVITVTPAAKKGILTTDTYVLTPTVENNILRWRASGGSIEKGYAS